MSDYTAPSGPPPPRVPEGWVARWNDQYKEWFYVNLITKKSQWDKPTEPARSQEDGPGGPPPNYLADPNKQALTDSKAGRFDSNNPYGQRSGSAVSTEDEDAKLAAKLQAEEDARARGGGDRGAGNDYYNQSNQYQDQGSSGQYPQQLPPRPEDTSRGSGGGFLGKLLGKGKHSPQPSQQYGGQQQYYPPQQQQQYYGGGPPPGPYGGYGGYPQQGYQQQPQRRQGGGLGTGGGLALGLGGGLLGGALLGEAFDSGDGGGGGGDDGGGGDGGGGGGDF